MPRPDYAKDAEENKEFDKTLDPEGNFQKGVYKKPSVEQLKEGVAAKEKDLKNRLLQSIAFEAGAGAAFDIATAPLGFLPPVYAALQVAQGSGTNILAQMWRRNGRIDWGEVAASGAVGLIPGAAGSASGLKAVGKGALRSSVGSVAHEGIRIGIDEKRLPTLEETATAAAIGGVVGGGLTGAVQGGSALKKQITDVIENPYKYAPEGSVARLVSETGGGMVPPPGSGGRPAKRTYLYQNTYRNARSYDASHYFIGLNQELSKWGMRDGTFDWNAYVTGTGDKRLLGAWFESIPLTKVGYAKIANERMDELRKYYGPLMEFVGLRPADFQLHHQFPLVASLPGYDGLRFGSDQWWETTEILFKKGIRPGDSERNLRPLVGGSKPSKKTVKNKEALVDGQFQTPHSVTHKFLDVKVGPDGTKFWTEEVRDRINGRGKWAKVGPDHQYRLDMMEDYATIINQSKTITDQAEAVFEDLYKRNPTLKDVPMEPDELDRLIERLAKLDDNGLLNPKLMKDEWQVDQMEAIALDVLDELEADSLNMAVREFLGFRGLFHEKMIYKRMNEDYNLRYLETLPLSQQLQALQRYTGMSYADIDLLLQTQPNFDLIKFLKKNR